MSGSGASIGPISHIVDHIKSAEQGRFPPAGSSPQSSQGGSESHVYRPSYEPLQPTTQPISVASPNSADPLNKSNGIADALNQPPPAQLQPQLQTQQQPQLQTQQQPQYRQPMNPYFNGYGPYGGYGPFGPYGGNYGGGYGPYGGTYGGGYGPYGGSFGGIGGLSGYGMPFMFFSEGGDVK